MVDETIRVRLHSVRDSRLAVVVDRALCEDFAGGAAVAQALSRNGEKVSVRDGFPVQTFAVGGEGDACEGKREG
jgi:hypothetical protein